MSLSSLLIIFSSSFMALFPVINPLGNGFVVNGFFANLDPSQRKTAIQKLTINFIMIGVGTYLPAFGKTKDVTEPAMPTTASRPSTSRLTGFLYGTNGIKARTGRSAVSLHQTCLSTDLLHP